MARIFADDASVETLPIAHGKGVYVSEIDAAYEAVAPYLSLTQREKFREELSSGRIAVHPDDEETTPSSGMSVEDFAVSDPSGYIDDDDDVIHPSGKVTEMGLGEQGEGRDTIMRMRDLYEVAMLITGRWGKLALPDVQAMSSPPSSAVFRPRRSLSVFRSDGVPGQWMSFPERMQRLEDLLASRLDAAKEAYVARFAKVKKENVQRRREGKKPRRVIAPPKGSAERQTTNWVGAFSTMLAAVRFVRRQLRLPAKQRTILSKDGKLPFGLRWGVLGANGNSKLPFIAYSELPMSTCPGADACGVYKKDASTGAPSSGEKGNTGWCYSFTAWRYPASFTRQFLNTLANTADREFTILRALGDDASDGPDRYWVRVKAASQDLERDWIQHVKAQVLRIAARIVKKDLRKGLSPNTRNGGRSVFLRLFVDGDVGTPDAVMAWMRAISQMASRGELERAFGRRSVRLPNGSSADHTAMGPVLAYGYSKAWGEFVAADKLAGRGMWPENYTLNLSNASRYAGTEVEAEIRALPITRGGFNAVDFRTQLKSLKSIDPTKLVIASDAALPGVTAQQLRGLLELEDVRTPDDASKLLMAYFGVDADVEKLVKLTPAESWGNEKDDDHNRRQYERAYRSKIQTKTRDLALEKMLEDPDLAREVKEQLARDEGYVSIAVALKAQRKKRREAMAKARSEGREPPEARAPSYESKQRMHRKLVALLVHVLFRAAQHRQSGSCPLVCGNCVDLVLDPIEQSVIFESQAAFSDIQARTGAVHRCASRVPTEGYVPPAGKTLPAGVVVEVDGPTPGVAKAYRRTPKGKVQLLGFYGAEIYIGLH